MDQRSELSNLVTSFDQLSVQTEATLKTFRQFGSTANSLLDKEGRQLMATAQSAMDSLETATARLEALTARNEAPWTRECRASVNWRRPCGS